MIIDFIDNFKRDPTIKRHFVKALSWRIIGSVDTAILAFIITGSFANGIRIGLIEMITKIFLYFLHERIWLRIPFGKPKIKADILKKNPSSAHLFEQVLSITRQQRELLNKNKSFTIWLTGLSGAGKTTIAKALDHHLYTAGFRTYVLDGDNTRIGINRDLDFSPDGREENLRRVAEISKLFNDAGVIIIAAFISPFKKDREMVSAIIGQECFIEVFIDAGIETCKKRDTKGLYKLAEQGKIKDFTGVNSPYETPDTPHIHIDSSSETVNDSLTAILKWMRDNNYLTKKVGK